MIKWMGSLIGKLFIIAGALIMSQMPLFMQYYAQQLAGRVSELQWQKENIEQMAAQSGKSLDQYVQKFLINEDLDFRQQGQFMKETIDRWEVFSKSLFALENTSVWAKPFVFLQKLDWTIVLATYASFEPGLTLNVEGVIFAVVGMFIGSFLFFLVRSFLVWVWSFFRLMKQPAKTN